MLIACLLYTNLQNILPYNYNQWFSFLLQLRKVCNDSEALKIIDNCIDKNMQKSQEGFQGPSPFKADENDEDIFIISLYHSSLFLNLKFFVSLIIGFLDSPQASLRTKCLRIINQMKTIPSILRTHPEVLAQIISKSNDQSAIVRDTVLDLLGTYIMAYRETIPQIYGCIIFGISDPSTIVRKRAIKQLCEVYEATEDLNIRVDIASKLLTRSNDEEETISELSLEVLEKLWFSPASNELDCQKGYEQLTFLEKQKLRVQYFPILKLCAEPSTERHVLLVTSLKTMLTSKEEINLSTLHTQIRLLLSCLFNQLIEVVTEDQVDESTKGILYEIMSTLFVFSRAFPFLFDLSYLHLLKPYLRSASTIEEQRFLYYVVAIFRQVLPFQKEISESFLRSLESVLLQRLTKAGTATLMEIVPCLCSLFTRLNDYERLKKIVVSCLKSLEEARHSENNFQKMVRLIDLIGLFSRYGDLNRINDDWKHSLDFISPECGDAYVILLGYFQKLLKDAKGQLRIHIIDNMSRICLRETSLFISPLMLSTLDMIIAENNVNEVSVLFKSFLELLAADEDLIFEADQKLSLKGKQNVQSNKSVDRDMLKGTKDKQWIEGYVFYKQTITNLMQSQCIPNAAFPSLYS